MPSYPSRSASTRSSYPARTSYPTRGSSADRSGNVSTPIITAGPTATVLGESAARIDWTLDQFCTGWVEYGTTASYGSETPRENSFTYKSHAQTISGLTAGTLYHYRVNSANALAQAVQSTDATFTTAAVVGTYGPRTTPSTPVGANVYTAPGTIPHAGEADASSAIYTWLQTLPNGTVSVPTIAVFPSGWVFKVKRGICLNSRSNLTLWGYGATITVDATAASPYQYASAFNVGYAYGATNLSGGGVNTNIRILGFSGTSSIAPQNQALPQNSLYENQSFIECQNANGIEVADCPNITGFGGDFMRSNTSNNVWVHHNSTIFTGRQFYSAITGGAWGLIEWNDIGYVGYLVFDVEPNNTSQTAKVWSFLNNRMKGFYTGFYGGGFLAAGSGPFLAVEDIVATGNVFVGPVITGTSADLRTWIGQDQTAGNLSLRPQRITIKDNVGFSTRNASACSLTRAQDIGGIIQVQKTDTIVVTGNTNPGTGPMFCGVGNTGQTVSGNTNGSGVAR